MLHLGFNLLPLQLKAVKGNGLVQNNGHSRIFTSRCEEKKGRKVEKTGNMLIRKTIFYFYKNLSSAQKAEALTKTWRQSRSQQTK